MYRKYSRRACAAGLRYLVCVNYYSRATGYDADYRYQLFQCPNARKIKWRLSWNGLARAREVGGVADSAYILSISVAHAYLKASCAFLFGAGNTEHNTWANATRFAPHLLISFLCARSAHCGDFLSSGRMSSGFSLAPECTDAGSSSSENWPWVQLHREEWPMSAACIIGIIRCICAEGLHFCAFIYQNYPYLLCHSGGIYTHQNAYFLQLKCTYPI